MGFEVWGFRFYGVMVFWLCGKLFPLNYLVFCQNI